MTDGMRDTYGKFWPVVTHDPILARKAMDIIESSSGKEISRRIRKASEYLTIFADGTRLTWYSDISHIIGRRFSWLWCDVRIPRGPSFYFVILTNYLGAQKDIVWLYPEEGTIHDP